MLRGIGGVVAAIIVWVVVVTILNFGLRYGIPGYQAVEKAMNFTLQMMIARLAISFVSTLAAGATAAAVSGNRFVWPLVTGIVLLAVFIPVHYSIWQHFPIWYHLTFLTSLPVLSVLGGRFSRAG